jgi:predicted ATP-grasp superfamily ATP-dependent carboligase
LTRVLVTDAGRGSGLSIIRSLGRRGIDVIAADASRLSPGFRSRYAAASVRYPPPSTNGGGTVAALARAAAEHRLDLIVPVGEDVVMLLSEARARFPESTALALPEPEAFAVARDKLATVELARRVGVPTPRTAIAESVQEAHCIASSLDWPLVIKPQSSRSFRDGDKIDAFGVAYASDAAGLAAEMRRLEGRSAVLIQEYCAGEAHGVGLLMDRGHPLLAFQYRRLREVPVSGGPSSFRESVPLDPELLDHSLRILRALNWTGPAMVEFKIGADGPTLMEINGRLWGSLPLAVKSGVDLPGRIVDLYLSPPSGPPASPEFGYRVGVRSRDLTLEVSWIFSVIVGRRHPPFRPFPRRREALTTAVRLFNPRDGYDVQSMRDPIPGLVDLLRIGARAASRAAGKRSDRAAHLPG